MQHLSQLATDGPVLITAGQQGTEAFDPAYTEGQTYVQDLGLATTTSSAQILANNGAGDFSASASPSDTRRRHRHGRFQRRRPARPGRRHLVDPGDRAQQRLGRLHRRQTAIPSPPATRPRRSPSATSPATQRHLDIAVLLASTSTGAYSVAVYTGNGDGRFATPVISAAGNGDASGSAARHDGRRRLQRRRQDRPGLHHRQRPGRRDARRAPAARSARPPA